MNGDWTAKAKQILMDVRVGKASLEDALTKALSDAARVPEAEIERLRWEIKCARRFKNWRSTMGGPDQSEVREAWEAAIRENNEKDAAALKALEAAREG